MSTTISKYKYWGGFGGLLLLNIIISYTTYVLFFNANMSIEKVDLVANRIVRNDYMIVLSFQLIFFLLFVTQCRLIKIDEEKITFINPLIPFKNKKIYWTEIDYCTTVLESPA